MQFLLYCVCGGVGVLTDYAVFYAALTFGVGHQAANAAGYLGGTLVSFALNRSITFGMRDQTAKRLALFLSVAATGYGTSAALLWLLVDYLGVDARLAKLLTLPVVVVLQFALNRWITFNPRRADDVRGNSI
ncbi:GtrA family protein [Cupriavidus respiraculi]|uniref:GtrA family protein n=1 Tax=Cupriavidus respiraculi TaxID=195930 RepID=UPI001C95E77A|nr:GtrA family protein [Cupriavidus respiraculi]MBY4949077.1 GtrA family protein [Cupriavidus respiraculi]